MSKALLISLNNTKKAWLAACDIGLLLKTSGERPLFPLLSVSCPPPSAP